MFVFTLLTLILLSIGRIFAQTCSCSGSGPEFAVSYSRSIIKQLQNDDFEQVFEGPMYCTNYVISDASADDSCGAQNSLKYIIIPTSFDCLNSAIWSLRDVTNADYVTGFDPLVGASPAFYTNPSDPSNPTSISGIKIPLTIGQNPTRTISICTREDTQMFNENDLDSLRTIGYVLNDNTFIRCVNSTMRDICSASSSSVPPQIILTQAPINTTAPSLAPIRTREPTSSPTSRSILISRGPTAIPTVTTLEPLTTTKAVTDTPTIEPTIEPTPTPIGTTTNRPSAVVVIAENADIGLTSTTEVPDEVVGETKPKGPKPTEVDDGFEDRGNVTLKPIVTTTTMEPTQWITSTESGQGDESVNSNTREEEGFDGEIRSGADCFQINVLWMIFIHYIAFVLLLSDIIFD